MITLRNISNKKDKFDLLEDVVDKIFIYPLLCHMSFITRVKHKHDYDNT